MKRRSFGCDILLFAFASPAKTRDVKRALGLSVFVLATFLASVVSATESLDKLADDFWSWRAKYGPFTGDDVNRMERPGGMRDWSRASVDKRRKDLGQFEARLKPQRKPKQLDSATWTLADSGWPIAKQVDYKLIGSALARVRWELDMNPRWKRDPKFYVEQTLTALAEALTVPAPYDEARSREILTRIENIPAIMEQAAKNLDKPPAPFASVAIQALDGMRERLRKMATALFRIDNARRTRTEQRC